MPITSVEKDLDALTMTVTADFLGVEEGLTSAMGQIDTVLADLPAFAADLPAAAQLLGDTQVRVGRVIHGPARLVWDAHHDPALLRRWLLGPEGWTMPVCEVAGSVGGLLPLRVGAGRR